MMPPGRNTPSHCRLPCPPHFRLWSSRNRKARPARPHCIRRPHLLIQHCAFPLRSPDSTVRCRLLFPNTRRRRGLRCACFRAANCFRAARFFFSAEGRGTAPPEVQERARDIQVKWPAGGGRKEKPSRHSLSCSFGCSHLWPVDGTSSAGRSSDLAPEAVSRAAVAMDSDGPRARGLGPSMPRTFILLGP